MAKIMNQLTKLPNELKVLCDKNGKNFFHAYDTTSLSNNIPDEYDDLDEGEKLMPEGWTWQGVQHFGGEGMGDEYYNVVKFVKGDDFIFVKFDGYYESYNGSEYQEYCVVTPKEVTSTVYN